MTGRSDGRGDRQPRGFSPFLELISMTSTTIFVRVTELTKQLGISRSTLLSWVKQGIFPSPRKLGPRAVAWLASEVDEWCKSRGVSA